MESRRHRETTSDIWKVIAGEKDFSIVRFVETIVFLHLLNCVDSTGIMVFVLIDSCLG